MLRRLRYARKSLERTRAYDTFLSLKVLKQTLGRSVSPLEGMSLWGEEKEPPYFTARSFFHLIKDWMRCDSGSNQLLDRQLLLEDRAGMTNPNVVRPLAAVQVTPVNEPGNWRRDASAR